MELELLQALQGIRQPLLDELMVGITTLGNAGIFWILLTAGFLCIPKYRRCGLAMAGALLLSLIFGNLLLKNLVARPRPCWIDPGVPLLIPNPEDFSFPSGHTSASFAAAWSLWHFHKKEGSFALALAAAIAFSRLYLFVHYPTDVLGGFLLGSFCAAASVFLWNRLWRKRPPKGGKGKGEKREKGEKGEGRL